MESVAVQGTVPYLGTFLTDLMMIDSALKDTAEDNSELINFDKHRKEFEILTQIRLLQTAAALYSFELDSEFWQKFYSIPMYRDSERQVFNFNFFYLINNNNYYYVTLGCKKRLWQPAYVLFYCMY